MATVRFPVKKDVLHWAVNQSPRELKDIYLKFKHFDEWLNQERQPTVKQIGLLASFLQVPFGFFFLDEAPSDMMMMPEFRTVLSQEKVDVSKNLADTISRMERIKDWTSDYRRSRGDDPLNLAGTLELNEDTILAAAKVRELINLPKDWSTRTSNVRDAFNTIRQYVSRVGVIVMQSGIVGNNSYRQLDLDEFRAFALYDDFAPIIFINSKDALTARAFSVLHEFVHLCLGYDDLFQVKEYELKVKPHEVFCNRIAAELFVPKDLFVNTWVNAPATDVHERIPYVASRFRSSKAGWSPYSWCKKKKR